MIESYQARRPLKMGADKRMPGELVPEAHTWLRVEHHVHCGNMTKVPLDEQQFQEAVQKYSPDLAEMLQIITGVDLSMITAPPAPVVEEEPVLEEPAAAPPAPVEKPRTAFPRVELETMELADLRELAKISGLTTVKKAEIIQALAED